MANRYVRSQDFSRYVPYQLAKSSHTLGWRGFRVETVRGHGPGEIHLPALDHHLINFIVSVPTFHAHSWDGKTREEIGQEGSLSLVPSGQESYWRWHYVGSGTPCDFHIHLDPAFVKRVAVGNLEDLPAQTQFLPNLCFYNPQVKALCLALLDEVEQDGFHGALYAESLATALIAVLLKMQEPKRLSPGPVKKRISQTNLRFVCDYIEAHLKEDLHLEQLGQLAGLGPYRFGEVFRLAFGESPHKYVIGRRIDRAKLLLGTSSLSLTEIALRLGFADHAHFTSTFHRVTGIPPSQYRREFSR
jgi:AraC family transcriptional regulator